LVDISPILLSIETEKGGNKTMDRQIIHAEGAPNPVGPYSQAVKVGGWLYISGQIPIDPGTGEVAEGPFELQTRTVLDNLKHILEAGKSSLDRVIKVTIFLTDMSCFTQFNAIYMEYFGKSRPARTCVGVVCLPKDSPLEIEAVATCD
jgi:2-iminobutanoate/2-iminopropanoate deaminase